MKKIIIVLVGILFTATIFAQKAEDVDFTEVHAKKIKDLKKLQFSLSGENTLVNTTIDTIITSTKKGVGKEVIKTKIKTLFFKEGVKGTFDRRSPSDTSVIWIKFDLDNKTQCTLPFRRIGTNGVYLLAKGFIEKDNTEEDVDAYPIDGAESAVVTRKISTSSVYIGGEPYVPSTDESRLRIKWIVEQKENTQNKAAKGVIFGN